MEWKKKCFNTLLSFSITWILAIVENGDSQFDQVRENMKLGAD